MFFGCFWAYVGQPHGHIHWASSMSLASINPTNPRTNLWNFRKFFSRIGKFEKRPFWIFFLEFFFFCFNFTKISPNVYGRMNRSKFWRFPWFPANSLLCVILRYTVYIVIHAIWSYNNIFHRRLCQARMFPTSPSRQGGERYHPTAICTEVLTWG